MGNKNLNSSSKGYKIITVTLAVIIILAMVLSMIRF